MNNVVRYIWTVRNGRSGREGRVFHYIWKNSKICGPVMDILFSSQQVFWGAMKDFTDQ